jgi:hypothetical protein
MHFVRGLRRDDQVRTAGPIVDIQHSASLTTWGRIAAFLQYADAPQGSSASEHAPEKWKPVFRKRACSNAKSRL